MSRPPDQTPPAEPDRITRMRTLLEQSPEDSPLRVALARELARSDRRGQAAEELRRVTRQSPDYTAGWKELGRILVESGDPAGAVAALERGIAVAEKNGDLQAVREMKVWLGRARREEPDA